MTGYIHLVNNFPFQATDHLNHPLKTDLTFSWRTEENQNYYRAGDTHKIPDKCFQDIQHYKSEMQNILFITINMKKKANTHHRLCCNIVGQQVFPADSRLGGALGSRRIGGHLGMPCGHSWRDSGHVGRWCTLAMPTAAQLVLPLCQTITWGVGGVAGTAVLTHAATMAVAHS